jgi:tRNA(Ile)-lysidine synthase
MAKRSALAQQLLEHMRKQGWLRAGDRVGVGVSGGADSVALLDLLVGPREKSGVQLHVVHFNHQLRGRASDADEKFVARLAAKYDLPFLVAREDVAAKAKRERANLEDAARRARYGYFERLVREGKVERIAIAHTADDQAETVLAHILRGTGLAGLGGIHPEAEHVFRPLLQFRRAELRAYLRAKHRDWREDATNRDMKRMRARIRQTLLPLLEKKFQPAVVEHLCQLAALAREDEAWLEASAEMQVSALTKNENGEIVVCISDLLGQLGNRKRGAAELQGLRAMSTRIVRRIVASLKPRAGQLSAVHVAGVLRLAEQSVSGKSLDLPGGVEVRRERGVLRFRCRETGTASTARKSDGAKFPHPLDLGAGTATLPLMELRRVLHFRVIDWPSEGRETSVTGAVLDRDRLRAPLVVRYWRPGDVMRPVGHLNAHRLARLLNELGASRWEKEVWPVLTSGGDMAWARGLPVATEFATGSKTRRAVVISEEPIL